MNILSFKSAKSNRKFVSNLKTDFMCYHISMEDRNFELLFNELRNLRSSVDKLSGETSDLKVEMAKIKTEMQVKSALMGAIFGLIGPAIYFIKKNILP